MNLESAFPISVTLALPLIKEFCCIFLIWLAFCILHCCASSLHYMENIITHMSFFPEIRLFLDLTFA